MTKLRVAIIGCGSIAHYRHLPEYNKNPEVEIVAVCDIAEERAKKTAEQYQTNFYIDFQELLDKEKPDAVSVCIPNYLHAQVSIAAFEAGAHVLCEKPMATSREEADAMINAAAEHHKKLMIAHNQRFVPSHAKAKALIESGEVGKIYSFRTTFGHSGPEDWSAEGPDGWFFKREQAFIGAMGDLGVHKADLLRFLLGEEFTEVAGFVETNAKVKTTVDDNAVCVLKTESGIIGTLAASWAHNAKEDNSTVIFGEKATLYLETDPVHSLIVHYTNGEIVRYELGKIQSNDAGGQTNSKTIDHFIDSIVKDEKPAIDGEDGKRSLEVILAALESSQSGKITPIRKAAVEA